MIKLILFAALFISLSASAQQASDTAHYRIHRNRMVGTAGVHLTTIDTITRTTTGDSLRAGKVLIITISAGCIGKTMYGQTMVTEKDGDLWPLRPAQVEDAWKPAGVFAGSGYKISAKDGRLLITVSGAPGQKIIWTIVIKDK